MSFSQKKIKRSFSFYYSTILAVTFVVSLFTTLYEPLIFILSGTVLMFILDKLGKGIVLRELIAFHSCVICLLMPWLGYQWYTIDNPLARLWVRYMPVDENTYFGFALPAVAGFSAALCWPIKRQDVDDEGEYMFQYIVRLKTVLERNPYIGVQILLIGLIASVISAYLPTEIQFVGNLIGWSSFAGILYIYFTPKLKNRVLILVAFALLIIEQAIQQGMFTIVAYMGITIFSFFFLQRKSPMWRKLIIFVFSVFMLFLIQNVKSSFRRLTWYQRSEDDKTSLFGDLVYEKLDAGVSEMFTPEAIFPIYYRGNQGFNIGLVMRRFPSTRPFDDGSKLGIDIISSFVPRFLWPDKPKAGGKYNMRYYTGLLIDGWSTNVGPMGEAYGSFGVNGGILYMFVLGLFIRWAYGQIFKISRKIPLLILWMPLLFYQITYSAENDTLQVLNSLLKSAFLIYIMYKALPTLFGIGRHLNRNKQPKVAV